MSSVSTPPSSPSIATNDCPDCRICRGLEPTSGNKDFTIGQVQESAQGGCAGCSVLVDALTPYWEHYCLTDECKWSICNWGSTLTIDISYTKRREALKQAYKEGGQVPESVLKMPDDHIARVELWTLQDDACPWNKIKPTSAVSMNTGSSEALARLTDWIQECTDSHEQCGRLLRSSQLPRRVVEILGPGQVRLRETNNEEARYVCLSHCWGTNEFICTTAATLAANKTSIPWDDLPRTFQDAIDMTWRLGIRHIWIDSLCILQGDKEDWRREGSKMCDVYSHAYLTLAASKSKGPTEGCYEVVDPRFGRTHWFSNPKTGQYTVHVRESLPHVNDFELTEREKLDFPLLRRAWVFQERNLSPRVVHFGSNELLWECMAKRTCECAQWNEYRDNGYRLFFQKSFMMWDNIPPGFQGTALSSPLEWKWRRLVEQYSTKELRFETDIFPALQGVAKFLRRDCAYHAGLWDDSSLLPDLLWHVNKRNPEYSVSSHMFNTYHAGQSHHPGTRPSVWRAPTWSWASVKAAIQFGIQFDNPVQAVASVLSIHTIPSGGDSFGEIQAGELKLKGRCIDAKLAANGRESGFPTLKIKEPGKAMSYDEDSVHTFYADFDTTPLFGRTIQIMEMLRWNEKNWRGRDGRLRVSYLVFVCVDEDKGLHERIGYVETDREKDIKVLDGLGEETVLTVV